MRKSKPRIKNTRKKFMKSKPPGTRYKVTKPKVVKKISHDRRYSNTNVIKEVLDLVKHHKRIIERKFPNYKCTIHDSWESEVYISVEIGQDAIDIDHRIFRALRIDQNIAILVACFSTSSINIESRMIPPEYKTIDYADPRFTDDTITDKLTELTARYALLQSTVEWVDGNLVVPGAKRNRRKNRRRT